MVVYFVRVNEYMSAVANFKSANGKPHTLKEARQTFGLAWQQDLLARARWLHLPMEFEVNKEVDE